MAERDLWASFQHDPRDPAVAPLRASDADRELVQQVLVEAFADGRLTREEYDERSAAVLGARTLGELPGYVADLVPERPLVAPGASSLAWAMPSDLEAQARAKWLRDRRDALNGFFLIAGITWTIWLVTVVAQGDIYFPWPLIPSVFVFFGVLRIIANRDEIVDKELRRLEKRRAKELRRRDDPGAG